MTAISSSAKYARFIRAISKGYAAFLLFALAMIPAFSIAYLVIFQNPELLFEHHGVHELAISISLLQGAFIAYVTYQCYLRTKEPFLCWLTLAFLGFTLIYGWHGIFTRLADNHMMLFILYGPASRFVMACCLFIGLLSYGRANQQQLTSKTNKFWWSAIGVFIGIGVVVFLLALSNWAHLSRWLLEFAAMCTMLSCAIIIILRRIRSPLITVYAIAVVYFALSSLAFMLSEAWNHLWWLGHGIFAIGFMALSYSVIQGYLTTGSFSRVYSQAQLFEQLQAEKERTNEALLELQSAHKKLEIVAATDSLTGCANRRGFEAQSLVEISRTQRTGAPLSFLTLDLDHFKQINDKYGHSIGDTVLKEFVKLIQKTLRPTDVLGRIGGEEFALLLPNTSLENAISIAERLRQLVEDEELVIEATSIQLTISLGIAQYGPDGETHESLFKVADRRMYKAKDLGRNRVVSG